MKRQQIEDAIGRFEALIPGWGWPLLWLFVGLPLTVVLSVLDIGVRLIYGLATLSLGQMLHGIRCDYLSGLIRR